MLIAIELKVDIAYLSLAGVLLGLLGTYLMTSAYHPFGEGGLIKNFFRVVGLALTLRWKQAKDIVTDVVSFGDLNPEDRRKSLTGIYLLFLSFAVQTAVAILGVFDVTHPNH